MQLEFDKLLVSALLSDYFLISNLVLPDGDTEFAFQAPLALSYAYATETLGIERDMFESEDGTWVKMVFDTAASKEKLSDYFEGINFTYRTSAGLVLMPDIYDGAREPKKEIWDSYLGRIVEFFVGNLEGEIHIPVKTEDEFSSAYAVYSVSGFRAIVPA